ncbi:MAG: NTP transferase domain-containing protein [Deltaproteobacteria bacterium]|nr:NTP transferase domain-containing protein [Deltaproteobacteria bacterium]
MLEYVLKTAEGAGIKKIVVVVGFKGEMVVDFLAGRAEPVWQEKMMGTGDAVAKAEGALSGFKGNILVLYGDVPLLTTETVKRLIREHEESSAACTLVSVCLQDPTGYGRILRGEDGEVRGIVEETDAAPEEKKLKEINAGVYCFSSEYLFPCLRLVKPDNRKGEYYLTDVIDILVRQGRRVKSMIIEDAGEVMGINTPEELLEAEKILLGRKKGDDIHIVSLRGLRQSSVADDAAI